VCVCVWRKESKYSTGGEEDGENKELLYVNELICVIYMCAYTLRVVDMLPVYDIVDIENP